MLTTAEAAALLAKRGIRVRGKEPSARTVEVWCRNNVLKAERVGGARRSLYLIKQEDLEVFQPPKQGRKKSTNGAANGAKTSESTDIPRHKA